MARFSTMVKISSFHDSDSLVGVRKGEDDISGGHAPFCSPSCRFLLDESILHGWTLLE